jgi:hypothetical protein
MTNKPVGETFRERDFEYYIGVAPRLTPAPIARYDLGPGSIQITFGLIYLAFLLVAKLFRLSWTVNVWRRDVSRRPYRLEVVLNEKYRSLEEAEARQQQIADEWNSAEFATRTAV